jgi:hypothetical protein
MPDEIDALAYLAGVMGGPPEAVDGVFLWSGPAGAAR